MSREEADREGMANFEVLDTIKLLRKSNSNHLTGRVWRSRHGVLSTVVNDTLFRALTRAWMNLLRDEWR